MQSGEKQCFNLCSFHLITTQEEKYHFHQYHYHPKIREEPLYLCIHTQIYIHIYMPTYLHSSKDT